MQCTFVDSHGQHTKPSKRQEQSREMVNMLMQEIKQWPFDPSEPESNALYGIKQIMKLKRSHPINEGISLVYFIRKSSVPFKERILFGSRKVNWAYHCCIGFKDVYIDKDWFIDSSYYDMVNGSDPFKMARLIPKEQYMPNIPSCVSMYAIPLAHLEYFVNEFRSQHLHYFFSVFGIKEPPTMTLNKFLDMNDRPLLASFFNSPVYAHQKFQNHEIVKNL